MLIVLWFGFVGVWFLGLLFSCFLVGWLLAADVGLFGWVMCCDLWFAVCYCLVVTSFVGAFRVWLGVCGFSFVVVLLLAAKGLLF